MKGAYKIMSNIQCGVQTCAHNKSGGCFAATLNIGGIGAINATQTCCGSYLNNQVYGNLVGYGTLKSQPLSIGCSAGNCKHNDGGTCVRPGGISVNNSTAISCVNTDTECDSFENQ